MEHGVYLRCSNSFSFTLYEKLNAWVPKMAYLQLENRKSLGNRGPNSRVLLREKFIVGLYLKLNIFIRKLGL